MIDITSMSSQDRLKDWRDFRSSIELMHINDQLNHIANYWSKVATVKYYFDFDEPKEEWPTPWELIHEGEFCINGIAYLMLKTIELLPNKSWQTGDLKLLLIKDLEKSDMHLAVLVYDQYLLNYNHSEVTDWEEVKSKCEIICEY